MKIVRLHAVIFFSLVELMFDGVVEMQLTVRIPSPKLLLMLLRKLWQLYIQ